MNNSQIMEIRNNNILSIEFLTYKILSCNLNKILLCLL